MMDDRNGLELAGEACKEAVAEQDRRRRLAEVLERLGTILVTADPSITTLDLEESVMVVSVGIRNTLSAAYGEIPEVTDEDVTFFEHLLRRYERALKLTQPSVQ